MQFQNPRCAFVTTNIRNVVVVIITATANFLLAPAPLLHHVWQGQGWPSEWWRPRTWCWDDVVCAMWRQNGMIHAWSRRIRTQAPWNGPHSTHVWGHGLVHTWSHRHTWPDPGAGHTLGESMSSTWLLTWLVSLTLRVTMTNVTHSRALRAQRTHATHAISDPNNGLVQYRLVFFVMLCLYFSE